MPSTKDVSADDVRRRVNHRKGVSTLWVILIIPPVLCLLGVILESGNLWLARVELINALEAASLAAAHKWGDSNDPVEARTRGAVFAFANEVLGQPVMIAPNGTSLTPGNPNGNATCAGNVVILGNISGSPPFTFNAGQAPTGDRGVHSQATVSVTSMIGNLCGGVLGPYNISAQVTARYDAGSPKIVRIGSYLCPGP